MCTFHKVITVCCAGPAKQIGLYCYILFSLFMLLTTTTTTTTTLTYLFLLETLLLYPMQNEVEDLLTAGNN